MRQKTGETAGGREMMNIEENTDERKTIRLDPVRLRLRDLLRRNDLTLAAASLAIGRNKTYLQQYVDRGVPAVLGYRDSEVLADLLGCGPGELRHETVPKRRPMKRSRPRPPVGLPGAPVAAVPEIAVEAGAGAGALAEEFVSETARWHWPENMLRYEGGAAPENVRILRVRGNSMEPEMRRGRPDRGGRLAPAAGNGGDVRAVGRQRAGGQAGRGGARRCGGRGRTAPAQAALGQPGLRPLRMPRPGRPHPRQVLWVVRKV